MVLLKHFVAIVEGRGLAKGEIGMASVDLRKPLLELCQFSESQSYNKTLAKLQHLNPVEVNYKLFYKLSIVRRYV